MMHETACIESCPEKHWDDKGRCKRCNSNCKVCDTDSDHCTECEEGEVMTATHTCDTSCPAQQFIDNGVCSHCD